MEDFTGLGLNIVDIKSTGRPPKPLSAEYVRDLTVEDVSLALSMPGKREATGLKKITDRHHALARLLAAGTKEQEASLILSMTVNRISIIKQSPAFQELLAFYRSKVDTEFATILDHMSGLSKDALLELRERLEEDPDKFSNRELLSMTTDLSDRAAGNESAASAPVRIELIAGPDGSDE